jgi:glycine/D-amino acid oxidase-like deaminating enzyme
MTCDVAIIGGGYTGLSAAYHLAREYDIDVVVLEAGAIGWGASGRNGGFCAMGGTLLGARQIAKRYGLEEARRFYAVQREAIELVAALADDEGLDIARQGEAELTVAEKPAHYDALQEECSFLKDQLGVSCRMIPQPAFARTMYSAPHQHGALVMEPGFGLHPLKYCLGLGDAAARAGARIFSNSEVTRWDKAASASGKRHQLQTRTGHTISAEKVIVACNGFMPEHLNRQFASRILPLQSQIIVTRPLTDDERAAHGWKMEHPAINSRNVYFYYRMLADGRFMIGGRADTKGTPQGAGSGRSGGMSISNTPGADLCVLPGTCILRWGGWKMTPASISVLAIMGTASTMRHGQGANWRAGLRPAMTGKARARTICPRCIVA